ncbi:response regulator [Microvirga sp. HBU67558]|uniref:response regulator n=1 Tax=Microvirga TaxID=186650 RepID=UPI001B39B99A|nr:MULTISPECIES: response regulator [unclassified Microvirga]MBQ0821140.1 response regulator [Microvirga sp. HBU67558]
MRILILEDDPWIATDLQSILESEGHEIVDSLGSLDEAYRHLDDEFDCALLDIDVIGGKSFGVAEALIERRIPFVFVSASRPCDLPQALRQVTFVAKPFEERALLQSVEHLTVNRLPC